MRERYQSASAEQTEAIAADFARRLTAGDFIALYGNLGSGKTAFVRGLASVLCPGVRVQSPTFAIVNEYRGSPDIYHFDMYRIADNEELYATGFYDYFERGGIIAAEWCENIPYALPKGIYTVTLERGEQENERIVTIEKAGGTKEIRP